MDKFTLLKINQRNLHVVFFTVIILPYILLISCSPKVDQVTKPSTSNQSKLDNAVTDSPNPDEYVWDNLGYILYKQGKLDDAIAAYRELLKINPNHKYAWSSLGSVLARQGKLDEAIAAYRKQLEVNSKPGENTWYGLGYILYKQGKLDDAIAAYRELLKINPNHKYAWSSLGGVLVRQGKLDEAIAAYRKQLEVNSKPVKSGVPRPPN